METNKRLATALLFQRLTVFLVMFMWTVDKFLRPEHASSVFANFYSIEGLGNLPLYVLGGFELLLLAGFLLGMKKRITYGLVLVLHGISTVSSFKQYLSPFEGPNLLFFAAWPMLAACFALYYLRDQDTLLTLES
ncbi:MAG TPA: hypothetical protein VJ882_06060 [Desulfuromonadales bacterium]|nr:hypothetical protein [Desulfuromonadales bacterium]